MRIGAGRKRGSEVVGDLEFMLGFWKVEWVSMRIEGNELNGLDRTLNDWVKGVAWGGGYSD